MPNIFAERNVVSVGIAASFTEILAHVCFFVGQHCLESIYLLFLFPFDFISLALYCITLRSLLSVSAESHLNNSHKL